MPNFGKKMGKKGQSLQNPYKFSIDKRENRGYNKGTKQKKEGIIMKKIWKIVLLCIAILVVVLALVWVAGRYGWKLFGFACCDGSAIDEVVMEGETVRIKGHDAGLVPDGCVGYVYKVEDGVLYFGVNYSGLFGFFETGSFEAEIPVEEEIKKVVLKAGDDEYLVFEDNFISQE